MSFGMWLLAFFCSPIYFACRGKWAACFINGFFYLIAMVLLISVVGAIFAPVFWMFCVAHAMWDMRAVITEQAIQRQAEALAQKLQKDAPK